MFDIGFFELSLIGVVALVVIGPERLPAVARTAGRWLGGINRFVSNIKEDISKEMKDGDLQKILQEQQKLADEFKQAAQQTGASMNKLQQSKPLDDLLEIVEPEIENHSSENNVSEFTPRDSLEYKNKEKNKEKSKPIENMIMEDDNGSF